MIHICMYTISIAVTTEVVFICICFRSLHNELEKSRYLITMVNVKFASWNDVQTSVYCVSKQYNVVSW